MADQTSATPLDPNFASAGSEIHHDPEAHPKTAAPDPTGRRKFVRTSIELTVDLQIEGKRHAATTENLSPGGVFVRTDQLLQIGETIDLIITMPNQSRITAHGVVRWVRPEGPAGGSGMGVQFLQMEGGSMMGPYGKSS